jgi:hypothetical protein
MGPLPGQCTDPNPCVPPKKRLRCPPTPPHPTPHPGSEHKSHPTGERTHLCNACCNDFCVVVHDLQLLLHICTEADTRAHLQLQQTTQVFLIIGWQESLVDLIANHIANIITTEVTLIVYLLLTATEVDAVAGVGHHRQQMAMGLARCRCPGVSSGEAAGAHSCAGRQARRRQLPLLHQCRPSLMQQFCTRLAGCTMLA